MRFTPVAVAAIVLAVAQIAAAADKPNILILFTDDQRADTIGALGNPDIHTPNLDGLAERGFSATSAYCLGANMGAVCRPSRNMLLSGRTYFRWAFPAAGEPQPNAPALPNTLPATFNQHGYETYHHGKRGNSAELIHKQFDHSHYLDDFADRWSGDAGRKVVDDAIAFLDQREAADAPWLMYLAFATPHDPRAASAEALARYDAATLTLPPNTAAAHPFDNGSVLVRDEWTALWPRTPQVLRDQWHDYYAVITTIDANIGRLIDELKARGEYDNTIIVFSSDHGLSMGGHGLMGKQNVYEHGYKAPMLIAGPGVPHGNADDPVYLMDLLPTLCELTGIPVPDGLDGRSFAAMARGRGPGPHEAVMLSYIDVQRAVRQENWKLIRYPKINRTQLFDVSTDPHELHDLAGDPSQAPRIDALLATMRRLQREQGDDLPLTSDDPAPAAFRPPLPTVAGSSAPHLGTNLRTTALAGRPGPSSGTPFIVMRPEGGHFTAISVGHARDEPAIVSGIRFDIVGADGGDANRRTVIVGDPASRWTPLHDQMNPNRQPVGIHGSASTVIHRLGIIQADGRVAPALGSPSREGRAFEIRILGGGDARSASDRFQGFHGTVTQRNGKPAIESIGLLYRPAE